MLIVSQVFKKAFVVYGTCLTNGKIIRLNFGGGINGIYITNAHHQGIYIRKAHTIETAAKWQIFFAGPNLNILCI